MCRIICFSKCCFYYLSLTSVKDQLCHIEWGPITSHVPHVWFNMMLTVYWTSTGVTLGGDRSKGTPVDVGLSQVCMVLLYAHFVLLHMLEKRVLLKFKLWFMLDVYSCKHVILGRVLRVNRFVPLWQTSKYPILYKLFDRNNICNIHKVMPILE